MCYLRLVNGAILAFALLSAPFASAAKPPFFVTKVEPLDIRVGRTWHESVQAVIKRPSTIRPGAKLPTFILLGGFDEAAKSIDLFEPDVPVILASFDYPWPGPKRFRWQRSLQDARRAKMAIQMTSVAIHELIIRLRMNPYVDGSHICLVGASFGAPFVLHAAAEEPSVSCLVLVQGFADIPRTMAHRLAQQMEGRLDGLAWPLAAVISRALVLYLDPPRPERDAERLRPDQRVLCIEAAGDTFIPAAAKELLWTSLKKSGAQVERTILPGEHLNPGAREQIAEIMRLIERWSGLLPDRTRASSPRAAGRASGEAPSAASGRRRKGTR